MRKGDQYSHVLLKNIKNKKRKKKKRRKKNWKNKQKKEKEEEEAEEDGGDGGGGGGGGGGERWSCSIVSDLRCVVDFPSLSSTLAYFMFKNFL